MKLHGTKLVIDTSKMLLCDLCGNKRTDKPINTYKIALLTDNEIEETDEIDLCLDCKKKIIPILQSCLRHKEKLHNIIAMNAGIFELLKEVLS
jgi:hypothetical protein